jgi:hypothetical protein
MCLRSCAAPYGAAASGLQSMPQSQAMSLTRPCTMPSWTGTLVHPPKAGLYVSCAQDACGVCGGARHRLVLVGGWEEGFYSSDFATPLMTLSPYTGVWAAMSATPLFGASTRAYAQALACRRTHRGTDRYHAHHACRALRYAAAATVLGDYVVVYGGSVDYQPATASTCFSASMMALDLACGTWTPVSMAAIAGAPGRLGHDLVVRGGVLYAVGGTSGAPWGSILALEHDRCAWWRTAATCTADASGCVWNATIGACREAPGRDAAANLTTAGVTGLGLPVPACSPCTRLTTAPDCDRAYAGAGCVWCAANATCLAVGPALGPASPSIMASCQRNDTCFASTATTPLCAPAHRPLHSTGACVWSVSMSMSMHVCVCVCVCGGGGARA